MSARYLVYGAGDLGTQALLARMFELRLSVDFNDIRTSSGGFENLRTLLNRNTRTIPILLDQQTGEVFENFESALMHIESDSNPYPCDMERAE